MISAACWISLRTVNIPRIKLFKNASIAILIGGGTTFLLITQIVLSPEPQYNPKVLIPLAGMIFASCMTGISLTTERFQSEIQNGKLWRK